MTQKVLIMLRFAQKSIKLVTFNSLKSIKDVTFFQEMY